MMYILLWLLGDAERPEHPSAARWGSAAAATRPVAAGWRREI